MKKLLIFKNMLPVVVVLLWGITLDARAQVTLIYPDATPNANFTTIQLAYNAIDFAANAGAHTIQIESTYLSSAETFPITLGVKTSASASNNITIKPATGAKVTIGNPNSTSIFTNVTTATNSAVLTVSQSTASVQTGMAVYGYGPFINNLAHPTVSSFDATTITCSRNMSVANSGATIYVGTPDTKTIVFNGAKYVTIDGVSRTSETIGLTIQNPNSIQASTIWIDGGSQYNTIQNCFIKGANQSGMAFNNGGCGQIMFYNGENDFNTITNNDICDIDGLPMPICMVSFTYGGSSANNDNTLSYNNIYNIGNGTSPAGNTSFVHYINTGNTSSFNNHVLNNRMYWTKTAYFRRNPYAIVIALAGLGNRIEDNVIGWQADGVTRAEIRNTANTSLGVFGVYVKNTTFKNNIFGGLNIEGRSYKGIELYKYDAATANADDICNNNQVKDVTVTSAVTSASVMGIQVAQNNTFTVNIKDNKVDNLIVTCTTSTHACNGTGIFYEGVGTANVMNFTGNQISNIVVGDNNSSAANWIVGVKAGANAELISNNLIYNLDLKTSNTASTSYVRGLQVYAGISTGSLIRNNVLRIGTDVSSNVELRAIAQTGTAGTNFRVFHNTVYIGGTSNTNHSIVFFNSAGNVNLRNNIFCNLRTGGTAKNLIYYLNFIADVTASDHNLYQYGQFAYSHMTPATTDYGTLANWVAAKSGFETNSINQTNPLFIAPTATTPDLQVQTYSSAVAQQGATGTGVTDDYNGVVRASAPALGAYEFVYTSQASDYYRSLATGNWGTGGTWQSSLNNANWATASSSPTSSAASVLIQNAHEVTVGANATAPAITINGGGKLTLNDGFTLNAASLTLQSHATNGTATVKDLNEDGGLTVTGTTTVNQHLTTGRNWYISNPVSATSLPTVASGTRTLHRYDETIVTDAAGATGWVENPASVTVGNGYVASVSVTGDLTFTGALNTGNKDIVLTSRTGTANKAGFNLIGNPYASYLDWAAVMTANTGKLRSSTLWYRTKMLNQASELVYSFWTVNGDGVGVPNGASALIPPMQSFWVRAIEGGSTISLTNEMRAHAPATDKLLKAPAAANTNRTLVRLQVSNGVNADETVLYFNANAQDGADSYDAPKMSNGNANIPEIFTTVNNERMAINCMSAIPLNTYIGLGFDGGSASSFSIRANEISNLPEGIQMILKDNVTLTETNLTDSSSDYQFSTGVAGDDRFSLMFRSPGSVSSAISAEKLNIHVYVNQYKEIVVNAPENTMLSIYNSLGQLVGNGITVSGSLKYNLQSGIYVVKVANNFTSKVIIP